MARTLSPDELSRYPWATRINDYVPVGPIRKAALLSSVLGALVLLAGVIASLAMAENIHHAVNMGHLPTKVGVYGSMVLTGIGGVLGIITGIQALLKSANSLVWWAAGAVIPALIVFVAIRPLIH